MRLGHALVLMLLAGALVSGCGGDAAEDDAAPSPPPTSAPTPDPGTDRPLAAPVAGTSLDGEPVALEDFRGRPVLVNVWSAW